MAKVPTAKSDAPPLRMIVERGPRLSPASQFDAERLDSYRIGSVLRFVPVLDADRRDVRRWWAILNRAIKTAKTPWSNTTQASEGIKLALGIVNLGKTVGGKMMQFPKSLNELDDEDLAEAVRDMSEIIYRMTGIDPADWQREAADVGLDEEQDSPGPHPCPPGEEGSGVSSPQDPAPTNSEIASPAGGKIRTAQDEAMDPASMTGQPPVDAESPKVAPEETVPPPTETSGATLTDDDKAFLVDVYIRLVAAVGPDVDVLKVQTTIYKDSMKTRSTLVKAKATKIREELEKCCGEKPASHVQKARKYIAALIGVEEKDLEP